MSGVEESSADMERRSWRRGRLLDSSQAPRSGERFEEVVALRHVLIEQVLSASEIEPTHYLQSHDEWVTVLAGQAVLEVQGENLALGPGDWVLLPAGTPHRVVETEAGTSWLAVHVRTEA